MKVKQNETANARRDNACIHKRGVILSARSGSVPPVKVEARP